MVHIGKTLQAVIAVVLLAGHFGQGLDNTSWSLETGHNTESTARDVLSTTGLTDSAPPREPAAVHILITLLLPETKQSTGINRTKLTELQVNWIPNTSIENDTFGSGRSSVSILLNRSLAARNQRVDRRINTRSQVFPKLDNVGNSHEQNSNVLFGNASAYTSRTFKRATRDNNLARDQAPLLSEQSVRDAATLLTHDSNDSMPAVMSVSGVFSADTSAPAFMSVPGVINNDTSAPAFMSVPGFINNDTSAPAFMSVPGVINNDTSAPAFMSVAGVINNDTSAPAFMSVPGVINNDTSAPAFMSVPGVVNNDTSVPAFMSVSGVVNNNTRAPTFMSVPGVYNNHTSAPAVMSLSGVFNNYTSAPAFVSVSGVVNNNTSSPAVMSVPSVVSNHTSAPPVMPVSESFINPTHQQHSTLGNTNGLNGQPTDIDDVATFSVKLGDLSFTVCSDITMCRHRCATVSGSAAEVQHAARRKRQTAISDKQSDEHASISQDLSRNEQLEEINLQRKQRTTFTTQLDTGIQEESETTLLSPLQAETRQTSQPRFSPRKHRSTDGNIPDARCANNSQNYTCFCDDSCVLYGDCCVDVFQSCFSTTNIADIMNIVYDIREIANVTTISDNLTTVLNNTPEKSDHILNSFMSKFASCEKVEWIKYVYLVSLCPPDFLDLSLRSKCENSDDTLLPPVTAVFPKGSVGFKNIHCAQCHSFDADSLQPWLVNLDCYKTSDSDIKRLTIAKMTELVASKECNVTYTIPSGTCEPRLCDPGSQLSQARKDQIALKVNNGTCAPEDAVLCQTYTLSQPYRNPSCDRCLNSTHLPHLRVENMNICNLTNPFINPPPNSNPGRGGWNPTGGILIILDITGIYSNVDKKTSFYACENNEVFDPFFLQCRTLICPSGLEPFRGSCIDSSSAFFVPESSQIFPDGWSRLDILTNTSETSSYISCGQILENTEAKIPHKHFVLQQVLINDYKDINGTFPQNISTSFFQCEEIITRQQSSCLQSVDVILSITEDVSLDTINELEELAESLIPLRSEDEGFRISLSNMRSFPKHASSCTYGRVLAQRSDFSLLEYKGVAYAVFNHTKEGVFYPLGNIGYELTIAVLGKADSSLNFLYKVYICQEQQLLFRKNCSIVVYFLNETQPEGTRLLIKTSNEYYNEGDFYADEDQVYVCSNFDFKIEQGNGNNSVTYVIVTCVLTALSVACLLVMIIIYCIFPELRSLPGKMSATLAATMLLTFVANLLSLANLHNDYICPVLAAVSHVITLSHFGWMAAISVNMALTFGPGIHSLVKFCDDKKAYLRYSIVVWGLSFVIVFTSAIMDFTHRGDNTNQNCTTSAATDQSDPSISAPKYPRYGEPYCTWFSGPLWVRLAFIIIPYFLTYIISATGFLVTLVGIKQSNKSAAKVGHKTSEKTLCLIYIKLSTAMGFAWILSIVVSVYPDSDVLPYVYVCLVLLQGVLLFLAFTANKRVYSLIMKKYCSVYKSNSKDGTQISSVMTNTL